MKIKCPYCGYDGSDLTIGRTMPYINHMGKCLIRCSKCKREFNFEIDMNAQIVDMENYY